MPDSKLRLPKPKLSSHPVDVGQRTEGAILAHLVRLGYRVLVPIGVNQRYDLVLDVGGELLKAQCKTGRLRDGAVRFSTISVMTSKTRNVPRRYNGDADVFLVHCPDLDEVYVVPVEEAPRWTMALRVDVARNGQSQRVNWAADYVLPA